MAISEQIQVKINWLKKSLSYTCVFCEYKFHKDYRGREIMDLPICGICLDKYNMIRNRDITIKQKQFLNTWFAGKCYLCERTVSCLGCFSQRDCKAELKKNEEGYNLCQSACYQRFRMISDWQKKNESLGETTEKAHSIRPMSGTGVNLNNSYSSYGEALKALQNSRKAFSFLNNNKPDEFSQKKK